MFACSLRWQVQHNPAVHRTLRDQSRAAPMISTLGVTWSPLVRRVLRGSASPAFPAESAGAFGHPPCLLVGWLAGLGPDLTGHQRRFGAALPFQPKRTRPAINDLLQSGHRTPGASLRGRSIPVRRCVWRNSDCADAASSPLTPRRPDVSWPSLRKRRRLSSTL